MSRNEFVEDEEKTGKVVNSSRHRIISTTENDSENEDSFLNDEFTSFKKDFDDEKYPQQEQLRDDDNTSLEIEPEDNHEETILHHKMSIYFTNFFPFWEIHRWLNYGGRGKFQYREFAYTLVDNETVIRNITFRDCNAMIRDCLAKVPIKIDIGARFHTDPQDASPTIVLRHAERELVFDIDLSDYDNIRTCCSESNVCRKCWKFAALACKILDISFREDFGWKHIVWVFSGRRGIHAWVCDQEVRLLSYQQRNGIIAFYTLSSGNTTKRPELRSTHLHRHIRRSYAIAIPTFVSMCVREQNILGTDRGVQIFLSLIPAGCYRENVKKLLLPQSTSILRWAKFFAYWKLQRKVRSEEWKVRPHLLHEIILFYTYPRLDSDVTTGMYHLLKAPFSIHPKTQKVCLPIDPRKVDEFDVSDVPSLDDLVDAIVTHETSFNLDKNQDTLIEDCESSWEDQDTSVDIIEDNQISLDMFADLEDNVEIIEDHKTLPEVSSKASVQKQKYKDSIKIFTDFVYKMEKSPD